jgi:hypothetical protein
MVQSKSNITLATHEQHMSNTLATHEQHMSNTSRVFEGDGAVKVEHHSADATLLQSCQHLI